MIFSNCIPSKTGSLNLDLLTKYVKIQALYSMNKNAQWLFGNTVCTLSNGNFISKIKNTLPIFGYMMHFCQTNNFPFGGLLKTDVLFCKSTLSKMVPVKTNKNKNLTPLPRPNFHDKKLCLWARKDSFTLKVLKMKYFFG